MCIYNCVFIHLNIVICLCRSAASIALILPSYDDVLIWRSVGMEGKLSCILSHRCWRPRAEPSWISAPLTCTASLQCQLLTLMHWTLQSCNRTTIQLAIFHYLFWTLKCSNILKLLILQNFRKIFCCWTNISYSVESLRRASIEVTISNDCHWCKFEGVDIKANGLELVHRCARGDLAASYRLALSRNKRNLLKVPR